MESAVDGWKAHLDRNALWVSLGALALIGAIIAVGVQVAPETFYDRFWWEDIYGPLAVDANQCRTSAACPGVEGPHGIPAKDGYTITSELVYGGTLAVLLYGIYVGLFRRYGIVADGRFVLGLLPWILLGPFARTLEDANVFCKAGTDCDPGVFAYVFISPVIYLHIALYVIAFMLLGVFVQRRAATQDPRALTALVGSVLGVGVALFGLVSAEYGHGFNVLPPVWFIALAAIAAGAFFHLRAARGLATMNLTVFVLGVPFILGCAWLIGEWLAGNVWAPGAWNEEFHYDAGAAILGIAILVAGAVYLLSRALVRGGAEAAWARIASRANAEQERMLLYAGLGLVVLALLLSGAIPRLSDLVPAFDARASLVPLAAALGLATLAAYVFVHVGREAALRPGVLLLFGSGINVALVFGHMIDGTATWLALEDPFGFGLPQYAEKHPFSDFLLRFWGGFLFPFAKLVMVLVVAWVLDREFKETSPDERNLVGLIKMAIFVLGFAPGTRDLLRVTMGV